MKERTTQVLLAAVAVLLVAQFFRPAAVLSNSRSEEAGQVPAVIRAKALELVGDDGKIRSRLNVEQGGQVVFRLMDQAGTLRVKLGADTEGSGLLLANDATEPGVHILAKHTGSTLKLKNKDGQERVVKP